LSVANPTEGSLNPGSARVMAPAAAVKAVVDATFLRLPRGLRRHVLLERRNDYF